MKRHIKNYEKVRKAILAHYARKQKEFEASLAQARDFLERVRRGEKGLKWPESERDVTERDCLERINRMEEPLKLPCRGRPRRGTVLRWLQDDLDRLDAADGAPKFTGLKVKIEWVRSRTWGSNPVAECWVFGDGPAVYTMKGFDGRPITDHTGDPCLMTTHYKVGRASGCGYDKRSAAVQVGISCPTFDRLVLENEECWKCYAVEGRDSLPRLSMSGKGVETLRRLFEGYGEKPPIPGFKWKWEEGRTWDFIEVTPNAKRTHGG